MNTATIQALQIFGLTPPTTPNVIKTTFRRLSKLEHPDTSRHPQAAERFRRIVEAHEILKDNTEILDGDLCTATKANASATTVTGEVLIELGKGLGPTINGAPCAVCAGKGYAAFRGESVQDCPKCRGDIFNRSTHFQCERCEGSGQFKRNGNIVGKCFQCKGFGWIHARSPSTVCRFCRNTRRQFIPARMYFHLCTKCKGAGEIAMWNPVLPKGLLL
jgi:DnaJ-class molecular chaperone